MSTEQEIENTCVCCQKKKLKSVHFKYFVSMTIEIMGITLCTIGLAEKCLGKSNPSGALLTGGALLISVGSFVFAKVVKWNEHILMSKCEHTKRRDD